MPSMGVYSMMTKERLQAIKEIKKETKEKMKGKTISNLAAKDKDELLLACCRMLGILDIESDIKGGIK